MRFGRVFYVIILVICVFEIARLWAITPPRMAAHFNIQGNADRFVSKPEFFGFQIQTMLVTIIVSILPQVLFLMLPVNLINMPNREYWLAPEQRDETLSRLSSFGAMLFGVILLTIQAGFELSVYANLQTPIRFNAQWMFVFMIISFLAILLLLAQLVISFRRPVSGDQAALP